MDIKRFLSNIILWLCQPRAWSGIATTLCLVSAFVRYFKGEPVNAIFWLVAILVTLNISRTSDND